MLLLRVKRCQAESKNGGEDFLSSNHCAERIANAPGQLWSPFSCKICLVSLHASLNVPLSSNQQFHTQVIRMPSREILLLEAGTLYGLHGS